MQHGQRPVPEDHAERPRRGRRWPWIVVAALLGVLKAQAYVNLLHHRVILLVALPLGAALSLLSARPLGMVLLLAPFIALLIDPASVLVGVAIAVAALAALLAVAVAIGTLLRRAERRPPANSGAAGA